MWGQKRRVFINGEQPDLFKELKQRPLYLVGGLISLAFITYIAFIIFSPNPSDAIKQQEKEQIIRQEENRH